MLAIPSRRNESYIHSFVLCRMWNLLGWCRCCCYVSNNTNTSVLRRLISRRYFGLSVFAIIHYQTQGPEYLFSDGDRVRAYVSSGGVIWFDS